MKARFLPHLDNSHEHLTPLLLLLFLLVSSPSQQHLCRCGPALPVTDGYRTRPSVLRCVQLLRSSGLQFRAPLCFPIVFLFSVPHSCHPCLSRASHSAGLASLRIAESLGPDTRGFCHPFASPAYLLTASLCLF